MRPFECSQPTQVLCELEVVARTGSFASLFGRHALVVFGSEWARRLGVVSMIERSLVDASVTYEFLEGVPSNPIVSVVDAGAALARSSGVDLVIGVGGGSVLDAAKAIAVATTARTSFRRHLSGIADGIGGRLPITASIPTIAIPTLLGSGSETNGTCVITDDVSGRKLSAHSDLAAPRVALIDPAYAAIAPRRYRAAGCADALAHAIEAGLSQRASIASDAAAESAIRILLREIPGCITGDGDAVASCLWASNLAGHALSMAGSLVTHPLAHPLSSRLGAHHGETVAALEPHVLAWLADRAGDEARKVASWMGRRSTDPATACTAIATRYRNVVTKAGCVADVRALGMVPDAVDGFIQDAMASGSRGLTNVVGAPVGIDDAREIYRRALTKPVRRRTPSSRKTNDPDR